MLVLEIEKFIQALRLPVVVDDVNAIVVEFVCREEIIIIIIIETAIPVVVEDINAVVIELVCKEGVRHKELADREG